MAFFRKENKKPPTSSKELLKQVKLLEERIDETVQEIKDLKEGIKKAVTNVGIIRFNPFKEVGGDQSFSIALLDGQHNGVVVTSYYGRDFNKVYAKPVQNGSSEYDLTEEEKGAISQSMDLAGSKQEVHNPNHNGRQAKQIRNSKSKR